MTRSRHSHAEEHAGNHERWLLTYADLITLLMVFFVVMYSMSRADVSKFAKLQAALQRAFRVEVLKGNAPTALRGEDGADAMRVTLQDSLNHPAFAALDNRLITTIDELRVALLQLPEPETLSANVRIGPLHDGVVISLSGNVLFDSGKADLKPRGVGLLDVLSGRLRLLPNQIRIEGHTDDVPISTRLFPTNWELSAARATTVARYLAERGGMAPDRLVAAGYGQHRPVAPNEGREGRARNRRVDIVVLSPVAPPPVPGVEGASFQSGAPS